MNLATFLNLLSIIGILFLLMVTGFLARRTKIINEDSTKHLSKLIIAIGQPMMIVAALISKDFSAENLKAGLFYMLLGFLLHPIMALFGFLFSPLFPDRRQRNLSTFGFIFNNCGFIGFPILGAIFGSNGPFYGAFFVIGFHIYLWTLGIWILSRGEEHIRLTPKKALLNYGTVPCLCGFLLYLLKGVLPLPAFLIDFTNHLGNLCLPISVLVTGALLASQDFKKMLSDRRLYLFNAVKLIGIPLLVCLLAKLVTLGMADSYSTVLFCAVIAALPCAATISMLAEMYDLDSPYAARMVGSTSILSLATLPLIYYLGDLIARL